ncbi:hypothetical protein Syun_016359 [Stephania yunnanensis]|uniref:Uncharacterized protein n=1 Tax=Stephania yunnanensis TaxID=152371 RepID=A0AAP0J7A5_9MAGN
MVDARAKAAEEAQSIFDDAHFVGREVFLEEVLADEVLVKETSLIFKQWWQGEGRAKGDSRVITSIPFAPPRRSKNQSQVAAGFTDQVPDLWLPFKLKTRNVAKGKTDIPSWLSPGAQNLIRRILDPNLATPITITDIKEDGWFNQDYIPLTNHDDEKLEDEFQIKNNVITLIHPGDSSLYRQSADPHSSKGKAPQLGDII